MSSDEDRDDGI